MTARKTRKISITLRSDLCTGSGYSYAGVVDNDVCYDDAGLPYIPARRLKGCLRETADTVLYIKYGSRAGKLFGSAGSSSYNRRDDRKRGEKEKKSIQIGNAYPEHYAGLRAALKEGRNRNAFYNSQNVLQRFSRVLGQTSIVDGVADDLTLRYTRVINQYAPWGESVPMTFFADITYDPEDEAILEDVLRATRHIGLKRTRGMGNVRIQWADSPDAGGPDASGREQAKIICSENDIREEILPDETVQLTFGIENIEPLVLSAEQEDESAGYISGQSVLGAFASRFLDKDGADAESQAFRDLFLTGKTIFTNFYPYVRGRIHYPSAEYLRKLKKSEKYVYALAEALPSSHSDEDYDPSGGNQPKSLKNKYVSLEGNEISVCDVERDIIYHHRHHDESGDETAALLYGLEVLRPGQCFAGSVIVPKEYVHTMKQLILQSPYISFGKSKTAQYGLCRLIPAHPGYAQCTGSSTGGNQGNGGSHPSAGVQIPKGSTAVVTFLSDAVFCKSEDGTSGGQYTVFYDEVREIVKRQLGIEENVSQKNLYLSMLQTSVRMGYLGIWNLRKPAIPVVRAGSCLSFVLDKDLSTDRKFIGERNLEGFGQISIHRAEDYTYDGLKEAAAAGMLPNAPASDGSIPGENKAQPAVPSAYPAYFKELMMPVFIDSWLDREILNGIQKSKVRANITNTALGRITLMLRECMDEFPESAQALEMYRAFVKRIKSIKSDSARKEGLRIAKTVGTPSPENPSDRKAEDTSSLKKLLGFRIDTPEYTELQRMGFRDEEIAAAVESRWADYLMSLLVDRKYKGGAGND